MCRALVVISLLSGCSSTPSVGPIAQDPAPATVVRVEADWNDVEAAALVAASKTESVVLQSRSPNPEQVAIDIETIRTEAVEVTARRLGDAADPDGPVAIELSCHYGPFGDAHQQARFLNAMTERLADLKGVDYRKVR